MQSDTKDMLVGIYGIIHGLLTALLGIALVALADLLGGIAAALGFGAAAGMVMIIGMLFLASTVLVWAASFGLFTNKGWAPAAVFVGFGITVLISLYGFTSGSVEPAGIVIFVLDVLAVVYGAFTWSAIPIGEGTGAGKATP